MIELRRDWLDNVNSMQREMDRLLSFLGASKPPRVQFEPRVWAPAVDVYETAKEVVVLVELAGVKQDEIHISIKGNTMVVTGIREDVSTRSRKTYHQIEIITGPFERGIVLPAPVDPDKAEASYKDGLLEVVLIKVEQRVQVNIT